MGSFARLSQPLKKHKEVFTKYETKVISNITCNVTNTLSNVYKLSQAPPIIILGSLAITATHGCSGHIFVQTSSKQEFRKIYIIILHSNVLSKRVKYQVYFFQPTFQ